MTSNHCPSSYELEAALHVAAIFPAIGASSAQAQASYRLIPSGGLYRLEDFVSAEHLLRRCKLLEGQDDHLTPREELLHLVALPWNEALEVLFLSIIERDPPIWVLALGGSEGALPQEVIPDADLHTMKSILPDAARREEFLLELARRFADHELAAIGAAGEEFVLNECRNALYVLGRADLAARAKRVSLISDQLGYDIVAPATDGSAWRIEVKTSMKSAGPVRVVITRNEATVGLRDTGWALVVCVVSPDRTLAVAGWCKGQDFAEFLPRDPAQNGRWMDAHLALHPGALRGGLPDLAHGPER